MNPPHNMIQPPKERPKNTTGEWVAVLALLSGVVTWQYYQDALTPMVSRNVVQGYLVTIFGVSVIGLVISAFVAVVPRLRRLSAALAITSGVVAIAMLLLVPLAF